MNIQSWKINVQATTNKKKTNQNPCKNNLAKKNKKNGNMHKKPLNTAQIDVWKLTVFCVVTERDQCTFGANRHRKFARFIQKANYLKKEKSHQHTRTHTHTFWGSMNARARARDKFPMLSLNCLNCANNDENLRTLSGFLLKWCATWKYSIQWSLLLLFVNFYLFSFFTLHFTVLCVWIAQNN